MSGVLTGFGIIAVVIAAGWLLARFNIVSHEGRLVLNRTAFYAASPALLFTVLARADIKLLFSGVLLVSLLSYLVAASLYFVTARLLGVRDGGRLAMGAAASSYSNVNNIGLPVATYVIGDAQFVGPMLVLQLVVIAPLLLGYLDIREAGRASIGRILSQPLRNPLLIASALGAIVSATGLVIPDAVMRPFEILGGAAVPLMLMAFGISLRGDRPLQPGNGRREVMAATVVKSLVMPAAAFVLSAFVFHLDAPLVYACTIMGALPTAQNMYQFALRYRVADVVVRDVVLLTTFVSLPVMLVIAALLNPSP